MPLITTLFEAFQEQQSLPRLTPMTPEEAKAKILELCPGFDPLDTKQYPSIYRGSYQSEKAYLAHPSASRRASANATNSIYNLVLSSYDKYPDRLESIISTLDADYASEYGHVYVAVPTKGTTVAVASANDIYYSFMPSVSRFEMASLGVLARALDVLGSLVGEQAYYADTLDRVKELCKKVDAKLEGKTPQEMIGDYNSNFTNQAFMLLRKMKETETGLYEVLREMLDPDKAGCRTYRYGEEPQPNPNDTEHEVWYSGPTVLLRINKFNEQFGIKE